MPIPVIPALSALVLLLATTPASAQWSDNPLQNTTVVARAGDQALPKSGVTSDGGRWVAWFDNASGNYDVYAQRFDNKGHAFFAVGGLLVSGNAQSSSLVNWDLMVDSSDNVVLAFTDTRSGGDLDVYAYRISSAGNFLWGANGVTVSANADFEADPMVTETTTGDFVVVWPNYGPTPAIRMQRISSAGVAQLAADGVVIASEPGVSPAFARVVAGNSGNVVVSWVRDLNFFTSIKHLRAQAFQPSGAPAWPLPVEVFNPYNLPIAYSPQMLSDGAGGAVMCWHASNPTRGGLFDAFVQHLDASGAELLPHNGTLLSTAAGMNHIAPTAAFNASTGAIVVFWSEKNSAQSLSGWFAQQVDSFGAVNWGANGKQILPVDSATKFLSQVAAVGDGAVGILGWSPTGTFGQDEIIATRLDAAGTEVWGGTQDLSSLPTNRSTRMTSSVSANEEVVVFWEDSRNGSDDIFGQNVHADGTLGADYLSVDVGSLSLAAGGTATLSLDAGSAFAGKAYWVLGSNTGTAPGLNGHGVHIDLNNGPYFQLTFNTPTHSLLSGFRGTLDVSGRASATVQVPAGFNPGLAGSQIDHAFVTLEAGGVVSLVSESDSFTLIP